MLKDSNRYIAQWNATFCSLIKQANMILIFKNIQFNNWPKLLGH